MRSLSYEILNVFMYVCVFVIDRDEDDAGSAGEYETLSGPAAEIAFRNGKATQ